MQEYKRRKKVSADKNTAAAGGTDDSQPGASATVADGNSELTKVAPEEARSCSDEKDVFYERLRKLNESSGLSLIINFRETTLDLYLFYKEVTIRGGFHQVTKDGRWDEIASILKTNDNVLILATQLQNVYKNILLHQFEQMYHYRTPGKASSEQGPSVGGSADSPNGLTGEKRHCDSSSPTALVCSNNQDAPNKKRTCCTPDNCQVSKGPETPELKPVLQTLTNDKELKKERHGPEPPVKARTAYQLYLKLECDRFKDTHGENSVNQKIRDKIIDTWRHLSESERKPYIDASNKDKERYNRQMAAYREHKSKSPPSNQSLFHVSTQRETKSQSLFHISTQRETKSQSLFHISTQSETKSRQSWFNSSAPSVINFGSSSSEAYDDYYVTLQGDDGNELAPDKSLVDSTIEMLKGAQPSDPIFQVDWDYSF